LTEPCDIFGDGRAVLHQGDVMDGLRGMADESVHMVVTSPPYWGLRDYGTATWEGGDAKCGHKVGRFETDTPVSGKQLSNAGSAGHQARAVCGKCGARRIDAQLGLEATPAEYVEKMVEVFREVKRVLRSDGTLWLNEGDVYCSDTKWGGWSGNKNEQEQGYPRRQGRGTSGLKPKDLVGMAWRLAFALQADGWWLRAACPWLKRSAMPESANDRPTSAVEYVFLLTKDSRYFYDGEAVRMRRQTAPHAMGNVRGVERAVGPMDRGGHSQWETPERIWGNDGGRSRRNSDWFFESFRGLYDEGDGPLAFIVNPAPYKEAHFATFPPGLVSPCIKAGSSEKGCCPTCGAPWRRVVERKQYGDWNSDPTGRLTRGHDNSNALQHDTYYAEYAPPKTLGWRPGCSCGGETTGKAVALDKQAASRRLWDRTRAARATGADHDNPLPGPGSTGWEAGCGCSLAPVPCTVLDPFLGSGTTAAVALQLGRRAVGIELKPEYIDLAVDRIKRAVAPATARSEKADDAPLFTEGKERP